jgi:hypothetical protein
VKTTKQAILILCLAAVPQGLLRSQVSITTDTVYSQSFDGLSGTGPAGTLVPWSDNSTIPGWYAYHERQSTSYTPGPPVNYIIDDGTATLSGWGLRSYGSLSPDQTNPSSDRALGELSSTIATYRFSFAVRLINSKGKPVSAFSVSYRGEQWKQSTDTAGLVFEYMVGAISIQGGTWTRVASLDFVPLKIGPATALDGNAAENRTLKSGTIPDTVANGQEIWLRWTKMGLFSCGLAVDDFSVSYKLITTAEPTDQPTNLTFSEVTATSMTVSYTAAFPGVSGYLVLLKEGSAPAGIPVDYADYAIGDLIGDSRVVYMGGDTLFSRSTLHPGTQYYFGVFAFNGLANARNYLNANPLKGNQSTLDARASLNSDVVAVASSETPQISSVVNDASPLSSSTGVQVWQVTVRDGGADGDTDTKPTNLVGMTLSQGPANTVGDWSGSILAADLFDGSTWLASGTTNAQSMTFTEFSGSVPDNGSKTLSLRLSLKSTGIIDHRVFHLSLSPQNILTESDSTSSQMSSFTPISSDSAKNVVQVTATKLAFLQQPTGTIVGKPIIPPVVVAATDPNNNTDQDYPTDIRITASGANLYGSPVSATPLSGAAVFTSLLFTTVGSSVALTASSGSWLVTSPPFKVLTQRAFYVDSNTGTDSSDGLSPSTAWQSLTKVNSTTFQPGDSLLFRSGCTWTGMLNPKGSGDSSAAIVIDLYGGSTKPVINGNGITGYGTVYFYNQQYWEVNNLEITNDALTGGDRRGVYIVFNNFGLAHHIHLKSLFIHNVKGLIGDELIHKKTAGIGIETDDNGTIPTRCDDILIEGCTISNIDNQGLFTANLASSAYPMTPEWMDRRFTNVRIRKNTIHHISKNAMILRFLDGGVVEHNVCYETATGTTGNTMFTTSCNGTVFQFNEGYYNRASLQGAGFGDGSMYDADLKSVNITFQYSYSHDNSHGLLWTCTTQPDSNIVCRYNVSRNDNGVIFCISYPTTSVYCYNNTIYIGPGVSPVIISERNMNAGTREYHFYNNIIYNLSPNASYVFDTTGSYTRIIDNNLFYGLPPAGEPPDSHKVTGDPLFVDPASAGTGWSTAFGFVLGKNSAAIDNGILLPDHAAKDFQGNLVPYGGKIDMGAFEYQSSSGVSTQEQVPAQMRLFDAYPNPFNPKTTIRFEVPARENLSLKVYDLLGREVRTLAEGMRDCGRYDVTFEGEGLSSGIYICLLKTSRGVLKAKLVLLK